MQAGDLQVLKAQAEQLEQTLNRLRERIEQLEENGG
jgi:prefoldin subunit 5